MIIEEGMGASEGTESTDVDTSQALEGDTSASQETMDVDGSETPETPEVPPFEPNLTFKVKDQEFQFDERFKDIIRDKETEDYVRDLYTKAFGLDSVKERETTLEQEVTQYKQQFEKLNHAAHRLMELPKQDLGLFLGQVGVSNDQIIDYVKGILEKDPKDLERHQQVAKEAYQYKDKYEELEQQNRNLMIQQHEFQMSQALSDPEVSEFARQWDERAGQTGMKFLDLVNQYGSQQKQLSGQYIPPQMAVKAVYNQWKNMIQPQAVNPNVQPMGSHTPPQQTSNAPKPPPNLGSGSSSAPIQGRFKSYDQIREKYANL